MKFKVMFYSPEGDPLDIEEEELGIDGLDEIRRSLNILDIEISSEKINGIIPELREEIIEGILPESVARKTGYFKRKNNVYVEVPEGSLNRYTNRTMDITRDDEKIKYINISLHIDTEKIIKDWKNVGYPIVWR